MAALHGGSALSSLIYSRARAAARRIAVLTCFGAALTCLGVFASTGVAAASCSAQPVSTPFSEWGDTNSYFLVPGGSFEGTADQVGWTLSGASLTAGNEPFYVNGSGDQQSLTINGGASATSPYFCVDNTMGSMRLFAQQVSIGGGLQVQALVQSSGGVKVVSLADLADGSMPSWAPTDPITGNSSQIANTLMVALRFMVPSGPGSWQIDDVYVDPYRSG
jgi:hypothetical protein